MTITDFSFLDSRIPQRLAIDIDTAEADKLVCYKDSLGNWTGGRGHLMPPAAPGRSWEGFTIVQSTSDRWFCQDLLNAMALAQKWAEFPKCDTEARQNALYEIAFNMGGKWGQFIHTRAAIEAQDWAEVKKQLLDSLWARQIQPHGLVDADGNDLPGRATRIANQFLKGEY